MTNLSKALGLIIVFSDIRGAPQFADRGAFVPRSDRMLQGNVSTFLPWLSSGWTIVCTLWTEMHYPLGEGLNDPGEWEYAPGTWCPLPSSPLADDVDAGAFELPARTEGWPARNATQQLVDRHVEVRRGFGKSGQKVTRTKGMP